MEIVKYFNELKIQYRDRPSYLLFCYILTKCEEKNVDFVKSYLLLNHPKHIEILNKYLKVVYEDFHFVSNVNLQIFVDFFETKSKTVEDYIQKFIQSDDKKSLGVVLTPHHISNLLTELVDCKGSVLDVCSGTGSLLIPFLSKSENYLAIEQLPFMFFCLLCNFIINNRNTDNLLMMDFFEYDGKKLDIGIINPPYSMGSKNNLIYMKYLL